MYLKFLLCHVLFLLRELWCQNTSLFCVCLFWEFRWGGGALGVFLFTCCLSVGMKTFFFFNCHKLVSCENSSVHQDSVLEASYRLRLNCLSVSHWISVHTQIHTSLNSLVLVFPVTSVRIQKGQANLLKYLEGPSEDKVIPEILKSSDNGIFWLNTILNPCPWEKSNSFWWVDRGRQSDSHPAVLWLSLLSRAGGENKIKKFVDRNKDKEIACLSGKTDSTRWRLIYWQLKIGSDGEKQKQN